MTYKISGQMLCHAHNANVPSSYITAAQPIVKEQLAKAAIRLAMELNQAFGH